MSPISNMRRRRIYYCAAAGCEVNSRTHPMERLFRFPRSSRNLERYLKWVEFSKNPRLRKDKPVEAYMCARHFTRNQFRTEYQMTLIYQAVPTIPSESYSAKYPLEKSHNDNHSGSPLPYLQDEALRSTSTELSSDYEVDNCSSTSEYPSQVTDGKESKEKPLQGDNQRYIIPPHIRDHCYSTNGTPTPIIDADHTYHSSRSIDLLCDNLISHSPSEKPKVLLSDLRQEEHPWFKITLTPHNEDKEEKDIKLVGSIKSQNGGGSEKRKGILPYVLPRRRLDPAKIQMSIARYKSFIQREKQLSRSLKNKAQSLKRLSKRHRERIDKIKELARSNKELTRLVEALSNSVSVCCDLLGIHDVVFKT